MNALSISLLAWLFWGPAALPPAAEEVVREYKQAVVQATEPQRQVLIERLTRLKQEAVKNDDFAGAAAITQLQAQLKEDPFTNSTIPSLPTQATGALQLYHEEMTAAVEKEKASLIKRLVALKSELASNDQFDAARQVKEYLDSDHVGSLAPPTPELVEAKELNQDGGSMHGSFAQNGQVVVWQRGKQIMLAEKGESATNYQKISPILEGVMPTITGDGNQIVFFGPRPDAKKGNSLFLATRIDGHSHFGRPKEIINLLPSTGKVWSPFISGDGLSLWFSWLNPNGEYELMKAARSNPKAKWGKPEAVPLAFSDKSHHIIYPWVSDDGKQLICTKIPKGKPDEGSLVIFERDSENEKFKLKNEVDIQGHGRAPYYIPSSKELFFTRQVDGNNSIWVLKNFSP